MMSLSFVVLGFLLIIVFPVLIHQFSSKLALVYMEALVLLFTIKLYQSEGNFIFAALAFAGLQTNVLLTHGFAVVIEDHF